MPQLISLIYFPQFLWQQSGSTENMTADFHTQGNDRLRPRECKLSPSPQKKRKRDRESQCLVLQVQLLQRFLLICDFQRNHFLRNKTAQLRGLPQAQPMYLQAKKPHQIPKNFLEKTLITYFKARISGLASSKNSNQNYHIYEAKQISRTFPPNICICPYPYAALRNINCHCYHKIQNLLIANIYTFFYL